MEFKYFLGIGSNIEPRIEFLKNAIHELNKIGTVRKKSGIYETEAWGKKNLACFLNAVVRFHSDLSPFQLLLGIKKIEKMIGRTDQKEKWSAREIDIDILFSDNISINKEYLKIPHEYFDKRNFVLQPMRDLNKNYCPGNGFRDIEYYLINTNDQSEVKLSIKNW